MFESGRRDGWSSVWRCKCHLVLVAFSMIIGFSLVTWFWYIDVICTRSPLAVRLLVLCSFLAQGLPVCEKLLDKKKKQISFIGTEVLHIEQLRGVLIETNNCGDAVSMVPRLQ